MWPWQNDVLTAYAGTSGDAAVELPTGTGKTLVGLVAGEHFREGEGGRVAYLAGDKQLAQQIERHGRDLGSLIIRFQGAKDSWSARDVRAFNFAEAIGVMKYWNYFNASPGVEPAGMLILDDTTVAAAILDRLLHHATVLAITGHSYRMRAHRDAIDAMRPALTGGEFS